MGARDLLNQMLAGGFTVDAVGGKLLVTPASKLTDDMRQALRACKTALVELLTVSPPWPEETTGTTVTTWPATGQGCADCQHLTRRRTCLEPEAAGLIPPGAGFGIAWPGPVHAAACQGFTSKAAP